MRQNKYIFGSGTPREDDTQIQDCKITENEIDAQIGGIRV